eukprot:7383616-Prymnesium_polylepis.1
MPRLKTVLANGSAVTNEGVQAVLAVRGSCEVDLSSEMEVPRVEAEESCLVSSVIEGAEPKVFTQHVALSSEAREPTPEGMAEDAAKQNEEDDVEHELSVDMVLQPKAPDAAAIKGVDTAGVDASPKLTEPVDSGKTALRLQHLSRGRPAESDDRRSEVIAGSACASEGSTAKRNIVEASGRQYNLGAQEAAKEQEATIMPEVHKVSVARGLTE